MKNIVDKVSKGVMKICDVPIRAPTSEELKSLKKIHRPCAAWRGSVSASHFVLTKIWREKVQEEERERKESKRAEREKKKEDDEKKMREIYNTTRLDPIDGMCIRELRAHVFVLTGANEKTKKKNELVEILRSTTRVTRSRLRMTKKRKKKENTHSRSTTRNTKRKNTPLVPAVQPLPGVHKATPPRKG